MAINAYNKFTTAIFSRLEDYNLQSSREITDLDELEKIMSNDSGYNLGLIRYMYRFEGASAKECIYDNGLIYLDSKITYRENNSSSLRTIHKLTLTTNYEDLPLVSVTFEKQKKAIQQLIIESKSKDDIFPESMKNIEVRQTNIYIGRKCGSVFESYRNLVDASLMLERYKQYYPLSSYEEKSTDLLRLCGFGDRYLEIIYNNEEPIFAQLSSKYNVEMAGFDPNLASDVKTIVEKVNSEVDEIVCAINNQFDKHQENSKQLVKNN